MKEFTVMGGMDLSMQLSIDPTILTPEFASEIASFWSGGEAVLDASDGDRYEAVARWAASRLWFYLMDGYNEAGAVSELHKQEGWCIPGDSLGIKILSHEIPDLSPEDFEVSK